MNGQKREEEAETKMFLSHEHVGWYTYTTNKHPGIRAVYLIASVCRAIDDPSKYSREKSERQRAAEQGRQRQRGRPREQAHQCKPSMYD